MTTWSGSFVVGPGPKAWADDWTNYTVVAVEGPCSTCGANPISVEDLRCKICGRKIDE